MSCGCNIFPKVVTTAHRADCFKYMQPGMLSIGGWTQMLWLMGLHLRLCRCVHPKGRVKEDEEPPK